MRLGYDERRTFTKVLEKARAACEAAGVAASDHLVGINKGIGPAKGAQRSIEDMVAVVGAHEQERTADIRPPL